MEKPNESIDAGLAPEYLRACALGAIGILVCGLTVMGVSVYTGYLDGQSGNVVNSMPVLLSPLGAVLLFALGYTWRVRVLPHGVEICSFFIQRTWRWEDFNQAEAGYHEIYFPQHPLWKRRLRFVIAEPVAGEKIWTILQEHVPPAEKWNGPVTVHAEPYSKISFLDEGIRIRYYFRRRFFSWDALSRAVLFRSAVTERGFKSIDLVFGKRRYHFVAIRKLREGKKWPADYDVVEFLVDHLPGERLVFCAPSGPARSIEEYDERKRVLIWKKLLCVLMGVIAGACSLYICWIVLRFMITQWHLIRSYWVIWSVTIILTLVGYLLWMVLAVMAWRKCRREERLLDEGRASLTPDDHG